MKQVSVRLCVSKKLTPTPGDDKLIPRINHFKGSVPATSLKSAKSV